MKKFTVFLLFAIAISIYNLSYSASAASDPPQNSSEAITMIDADSGKILLQHNANKKMLIASTTKIMTALIVLENCSCDEKVPIKKEYTNIEGSSLYLRPGEIFTVKELLYGLMLASGNDTAVALAYHTAGSIENFAELMNEKSEELGLKNTSFKNPHGLDEAGHYSTANDLAVIAKSAMQNEQFREIVATKSTSVHERVLANHNKLLWRYKGTLGIKTGYTIQSGRSLVSCAERDGTKFIIVTINDRDDWEDHMALYNWGFSNFRTEKAIDCSKLIYEVPVISGEKPTIIVKPEYDINLLLESNQEFELQVFLPKFIFAPITSNDIIGSIKVFVDGELAGECNLICSDDINCDYENLLNFWQRSLRNFSITFEK